MLDLNAIAWLEDYLVNDWTGTLLVVSHDRAFLNRVATDIVHMHSERLDYVSVSHHSTKRALLTLNLPQYKGNFDQFYETREERRKNQQREYEANQQKRAHLQAFIDRWRVNANRAAQAQSKMKELERMPVIEPPEKDDVVKFRLPETEKLPPPLLQLDNVSFGYTPDKPLLKNVNFDVTMTSRIACIGPNGAGKRWVSAASPTLKNCSLTMSHILSQYAHEAAPW
jgi:ATP-binding cassette, subfamily F, member 3